jgi:ATP synthase protein I
MGSEDEASRLEQDRSAGPKSGLGFAMRLGMELVVATMIGTGMGYWLDGQFDTGPWLLVLFMVFGSVAGFRNIYRMVQPAASEKPDANRNDAVGRDG